jgi:hypothetical protein
MYQVYNTQTNEAMPVLSEAPYELAGPLAERIEIVGDDGAVVDEGSLYEWRPYQPPAPTAAETQAAFEAAVQANMDAAARAARFGDLKSVISYRGDTIKPEWAVQAEQFFVWRSKVWAACYAVMDDVLDGKRGVPTVDELLAELPKLDGE